MRLTIREALEVIDQHNLRPPLSLWHYSFNIEYFFDHMHLVSDGKLIHLQAPCSLNQWSPKPIFVNKFLKPVESNGNPFWVCRLSSFNEFLLRRSLQSKKPRKHFPTLQTFEKKDLALKGSVVIDKIESNFFIEIYDLLKRPEHLSGSEVLSILHRVNIGLPFSWIKTLTLYVNESPVGIGLIIDDGKSQSLNNLASKIDANRFGLYMLSLWIRECCNLNYKTVDAGISGTYGIYKNQIFLDSVVWRFE